jgi:hypothetical protein
MKRREIKGTIKVSEVCKEHLLYEFMHIRKMQMLIKIYKDTFEKFGVYRINKKRIRYFVYADKVEDFKIFIKTTKLQVLFKEKRG